MHRELVERAARGEVEAFAAVARLASDRLYAIAPYHTSAHVSVGLSGKQVVISEPLCQGADAVYDRRIDLTFSQPLSATDVQAAYQEDLGAN